MNDDEIDGFLDGKRPRSTSDEDIDAFLGPGNAAHMLPTAYGGDVVASTPEQDHYIANSSIGRVLDAVGQGGKSGYGASNLGLDPLTEESLRKAGLLSDVQKGQTGIIRAFGDAVIRPAAVVLDAVLRGPMTTIGGLTGGFVQIATEIGGEQFGRGVGGVIESALADAGSRIGPHGAPEPVRPAAILDRARAENIIGQPERVWRGTSEPVPAANENLPHVERPAEPVEPAPLDTPAPAEAPPPEPAAPSDVHGLARQIAPETFQEYDGLAEHKDNLRQQIDAAQGELRRQAEAQAPGAAEIARLQERMADTTPRLRKKYQARLDELMPDYQAFMADDFTLGALTRDTPEIAALRQQLAETDYRMRDLAPDVTDAYRKASEQMPAPPELPPDLPPLAPEQIGQIGEGKSAPPDFPPDLPPATAPEAPPRPEAVQEPPAQAAARAVASITDDVAQKLRAAGRPAEEAAAAAQVTEALWRTRAAAFEGAKGTAEEMYAREAPDIRAVHERARRPEMAQSRRSRANGAIELTDNGQAVITLMKSADASTYLHEMGHDWLERLTRDAADPAAPERMRQDAHTVRSYLGVGPDGELTRKAHEKFARSFERYFMEGRAPSQALAGVFGQFKQWLTAIYQSVAKLRAPITADIRDVFDRMLAVDPESHVTTVGETFRDEPPPPPPKPAPLFAKVAKEPPRLASFLRRMGGVRDDGGDIRHILGGSKYYPGLINSAGRSLDDAALLAWEHGYFPELGSHRPSINDLRDALDGDLKGHAPRYSHYDEQAVGEYHTALNHNAEIEHLAERHGIDPRGMSRQQFFNALAEHLSAEQWDEEMRSLEEAHEAEFGEFAAEARDYMARRMEGQFNSDEFYGIDGPRNVQELEDAYRSENPAGPEGQGVSGGAEPVSAAGSAEHSEVGGGQGGPAAGDAGRAGGAAAEPTSGGSVLGRPDDGLIDKAGNIRLDNLNTPDDVNQVIRDAAAQSDDFLAERRGVVSDAQVIDLADALGMAPSDLGRRKVGEAFNAEQVMAARKLLVQSATELRDLMAKAAHGTDEDVLAYGEARARHLMIQGQVSGITAEAGRALRAFRDLGKDGEAVKSLNEFLQGATGKTLFQMRREAQMGMALDTPGQVSKFVRDSTKPDFLDKALEYWINGLISGLATHTTYMQGNALLAMWKAVPETAAAAAVGSVREAFGSKAERVYWGEVGAQLHGLIHGQRDGFRAAWSALKEGQTAPLPGENAMVARGSMNALPRQGAIGGKLGTAVRAPSRIVAGIHSYFRTLGYEQSIAAQAYRQAAKEGLDATAFAQRTAELKQNPTPGMMDTARMEATDQTLMASKGEITDALAKLTNKVRILKFVDPFVRISSNVINQALLERSPLGFASREIRENLMGRNGAVARDTQIARIGIGTAFMTVVGGLAAQDRITGGGPSDPKEAAVWRLTGRQPYSVRIGDTWYGYQRLGSLAMIMGVGADLYEHIHQTEDHDIGTVASSLVVALSKGLMHESFLRGPSELLRAVEDSDRYGARYVNGFLASWLPYSVLESQVARAVDPYARSARSTMDTIMSRVPFASQSLYPRRDLWGQKLPNPHDLGGDGVTAIAESRVNNDPVNKALMRLHIFPGAPRRDLNGVQLDGRQYDDYSRIAGVMAKQRLDALVNQPGFDLLPAGVQTKAITGIVEHARHSAGELVKMRSPALILQALKNRADFVTEGRKPR